jgi:probable F420-dependent oxidoreductase
LRPFRFATSVRKAGSLEEWVALARHSEDLGYSTLQVPDHFGKQFAIGPALGAIAATTSTIRMGCAVYANDFHHPALLAKEIGTLDLLSGGRVEFGLGAGWNREEYDSVGMPFDPPGVRVARLEESILLLKRLWTEDAVTFDGKFHQFTAYESHPRPIQRPHPPIMIGGGGRRVLTFAARHAQIVGLVQVALPGGGLDFDTDGMDVLAEKVGWVRRAAAGRADQPELHLLLWGVEVSAAASRDPSPHRLRGTIDEMVAALVDLRERFGISYITVLQNDMETFAPVVERLHGR